MTPETLTALKASIQKWERNAVADTPDEYLTSAEDCQLCDLFFQDRCVGCPVFEHTGKEECRSTPYIKAWGAKSAWRFAVNEGRRTVALRQKALEVALKEVEFLKSLLPIEGDAS